MPGDRPAGNAHGTRSPAVGRHGMIATSQPLASAAGLKVLLDGGNAFDAAITAAAVLAVVEPSMNGIGGDLLAIVWDANTHTVYGLDATGRSAYAATPEEFATRGIREMASDGVLTVDVPGVVEGWSQLLRFGTITLSKALQPAIRYARDGFPVAEIMAAEWAASAPRLALDPAAARTFLPGGRTPRHGELFANPRLATSLELIAAGGRDAFYTGPLARAIVADVKRRDGLLDERDFGDHTAEWVEPISTSYRGYDLLEMPPSTQGFVALEMLNILEGLDMRALGHNTADALHAVAEAKKIAFADRAAYLGDRAAMAPGALATLISKEYAAMRRRDIDFTHASGYRAGVVPGAMTGSDDVDFLGLDRGDTIYLTVADGRGHAISLIQSLFSSFGAGIVAGETGIVLQNRGSGFNLLAGHPNQIGPHKRPLHTLLPAMIFKDGTPWVSFGVMGGDNQGQAHAQVAMNLIDFGMNIQNAGEAARMRHAGRELFLESGIGREVAAALEARGHRVSDGRGVMGGFQGIMIDQRTGVLMGGSDPRKDGLAIGW
jgi:gamma-glutamyltranspeptidase/glutathione hydrolase